MEEEREKEVWQARGRCECLARGRQAKELSDVKTGSTGTGVGCGSGPWSACEGADLLPQKEMPSVGSAGLAWLALPNPS